MLSKGQILRARKAMERFYDGTCTITERQPYKRQNGSTGFRTVDVVTDQPCRLSYSSNFSADKGERASGKEPGNQSIYGSGSGSIYGFPNYYHSEWQN